MSPPTQLWLVCTECGRVSEAGAKGWKAYLGADAEPSSEVEAHVGDWSVKEPEPEAEVFIYCPDCAEREFGDDEE